jgi:hypothetical protein
MQIMKMSVCGALQADACDRNEFFDFWLFENVKWTRLWLSAIIFMLVKICVKTEACIQMSSTV